jgi:tetratricopeptide (TPR) repeat protein
VQKAIAQMIASALAVQLTPEEKKSMERTHTTDLDAWEYFIRGTTLYQQHDEEANAQARQLFKEAISRDPQFARAYASLAATYRQDWTYRWSQDLQASEQLAFDLAQRSVELDPSLPYGHHQLAYLYLYRRDHDRAIAEAEQAVKLDPNDTDGYAALAQILTYAGRPQEAIPLMVKAMDLNPKVPEYYFYHLGLAYYVMGQHEKYWTADAQKAMQYYQNAEENLKKALIINPTYRPASGYLVAVYEEAGREMEAQAVVDTLREMGQLPSLEDRRRLTPYKDVTIRERVLAAWQKASG